MSKPFYHVCFPPKTNWESWVHMYTTKKGASNIARAIKLIERNVISKRVPRDIWNMIVRFMFEHPFRHNASRWNHNLLHWLEDWVCDPIQQKYNRMFLYSYSNSDWEGKSSLTFAKWSAVHALGLLGEKHQLLVTNMTHVPRYGDFFMGIIVSDEDIAKIESITLCVSGFDIRQPFIFSSQYQAHAEDLMSTKTNSYYYCPGLKCVPLVCLAYAPVTLRIQVRPFQSYPDIEGVYLNISDSRLRDELITCKMHTLNRSDKPNTFIISSCVGCYKYQ